MDYKSTLIISRFEKTKLIGTRATQIANGAKPTVEVGNLTNCVDIAKKEYESGTIPLIIVRKMPDGSTNLIRIESKE